jgi:hypothetical protein
MSKGQSYLTVYLNLQSKDNLRLSLFLPVLGSRNRSYLDVGPPPPIYRAGWAGEVASWVLPCPPSLPTRGVVGDKGQPLHMTTYLTSQAQRSLNFTSLITTVFPISGNGLSTHPLIPPFSPTPFSPRTTPSPCFLWRLGMAGSSIENSAPRSALFP